MIRVRIAKNGYYFIPRHDKATEAELDSCMDRVGNELMWRPRIDVDAYGFMSLKARFTPTCYIVGKGASIDAIDKDTLDRGNVILAVNDAGAMLENLGYEPLTVIQDLYDGFKLPRNSPLLIRDCSAYKFCERQNSFVFSKQALGMTDNRATSVYAVAMAALMGCKKAIMLGFDSITTGSLKYSDKAANEANRGNRNHVIQGQENFLKTIALEKGIELEYITEVKDLKPEKKKKKETKKKESKTHESKTTFFSAKAESGDVEVVSQ